MLRAGWAEARILAARQPIPDVLLAPDTDEELRGQLAWVWEARRFAEDSLGLAVGDAYSSFTRLDRDTLALVLSAAPADRLEALTWWFPVVGRVPYRGFFDADAARDEQRRLEARGFDTYLRPTAAFSTLGWFSDPVLSTMTGAGTVPLIETLFHELTHVRLFVKGHVDFNESFANFVGSAGAISFFCERPGGGPRSVKCERARDRWADDRRFSRFLDGVVEELEAVYADPDLDRAGRLERRERTFRRARQRFRTEVEPELRTRRFRLFADLPLNNATLLARMRYFRRLDDFDALWRDEGRKVARAIRVVEERAAEVDDPWQIVAGRSGDRR